MRAAAASGFIAGAFLLFLRGLIAPFFASIVGNVESASLKRKTDLAEFALESWLFAFWAHSLCSIRYFVSYIEAFLTVRAIIFVDGHISYRGK